MGINPDHIFSSGIFYPDIQGTGHDLPGIIKQPYPGKTAVFTDYFPGPVSTVSVDQE